MPNITLSIPDDLLEQSRAYAARHGTSLNAFIRDLLKRNVSSNGKNPIDAFIEFAEKNPIDFKGYKWNREEANER